MRTFTYQPCSRVYIHVALRSAAVAVAAFSECLVFYTTLGTLDMLKFRSAVPIAEIWDSLYQCSEFPAGIKILFVFFSFSLHNLISHQNVHGFITLLLRFFVCVVLDDIQRCDKRFHRFIYIWLSCAIFFSLTLKLVFVSCSYSLSKGN